VSEKTPAPEELEQRLIAARPRPNPAFVDALEQELLPARSSKWSRWRTRVAALGAAGALATMLLVFGLTGTSPLGGGSDVRAGDDCRFVERHVDVYLPEASVDRQGQPQLRFVKRTVPRQIKRCR
jgi:hypothetical protein